MTATALIQARMTSSRLPGKVLKPVLGRPMLAYQLERVRRSTRIEAVVIATTTNATDDPVAAFAEAEGAGLFRGSEDDVLSRMAGAARASGARRVVRLTADCPLLDPLVIDLVVDRLSDPDRPVDYVTSGMPRTWPIGLDAEAMTAEALLAADREATDPYDREHVTPFLYRHPERFGMASVPCPEPMGHHRWTLDEPADLELIRRVLETLYPTRPDFGYREVAELLAAHPDWAALNAAVAQKTRRYEDVAVASLGGRK